ncbi:hypothetical protein HN682_10215 [Candidatus Peregrinibacteria bacterium]|jgi:hypothetical protein|nr:hypothetical protein [Candidatus Peregrinibacteria bacterium]
MAKYKEQNDQSGTLEAYVETAKNRTIPLHSEYVQEVLEWIAEGNTPDPATPYASSLSQARTKRIAEVKEQAKSLYRQNTDSYSDQYSMQVALGETPTAIPNAVKTYYNAMKQAFVDAKGTINAETDITVIAMMTPTFPTPP